MASSPKRPAPPPPSPSDDLPPRGNLPDRSVIPPGREFGAGAPKPKPRPPVKKAKGGAIKKMRGGGSPAPAPKPSPSMLSKLGSSAARLGAGAARLTGMTNIPGQLVNAAVAAKDVYDQYRNSPQDLPVQTPQRFHEEFYPNMRKGGKVKGHMAPKKHRYAGGGSVGSASRRADGIAKKGKTRGKMC